MHCEPLLAEKERSKTSTAFGGGLEGTSTPPTESASPAAHSHGSYSGAPRADPQPGNPPGNHPLHLPSVGKQQISAFLFFPAPSPGSKVFSQGEKIPHPNASRSKTILFQTGEKILQRNSSSQTDFKYPTLGAEQLP